MYRTDYYYSDKKEKAFYRFIRQNWYTSAYISTDIEEICFHNNMALHAFAFPNELSYYIEAGDMNKEELAKHMKWNRYIYTEMLQEMIGSLQTLQFLAYNIDEAKQFNENFFMFNLAQCRKYYETNKAKFGKFMDNEDLASKQMVGQ